MGENAELAVSVNVGLEFVVVFPGRGVTVVLSELVPVRFGVITVTVLEPNVAEYTLLVIGLAAMPKGERSLNTIDDELLVPSIAVIVLALKLET